MVCQGPAVVRGREGLRGVLEAGAPAQGERQVRVHLDGGQTVLVPADLLTAQPDGSYLLAMGPGDLGLVGPGRPSAPGGPGLTVAAGETVTVPVVEERAEVGRQTVEAGRVIVHVVPREREEVVHVPLAEERVEVERVPVNRAVESAGGVRQEGDVTIIPVYEEVLVVEKRLVLKEEVRLTRRRDTRPHERRVTLRAEEARVERTDGPARTADPASGGNS